MNDSDYAMDCYTEITYAENTINKLHIMTDLHSDYTNKFYHNKIESIDDLFFNTLNPY